MLKKIMLTTWYCRPSCAWLMGLLVAGAILLTGAGQTAADDRFVPVDLSTVSIPIEFEEYRAFVGPLPNGRITFLSHIPFAFSNTTYVHVVDSAITVETNIMWASGDFAVIGTTLQIVGELLNEAADVQATDRVLDVAAGNGNATLAAARRFASVTSTDYVPALLEGGRRRAEAEGFDTIRFEVADAEALPYAEASFDVVLSTFGVMFAPDHERAAGELQRVCKSGGRIGLASWTPSGFLGQLFRVVAQYVPPIPGVRSPLLWGTDAHLRELFASATSIEHATRTFAFRYRSPEHWVDVFRTYYGPVHKAFLALDEDRQSRLEADLIALLRSLNRGGGAGLVVPGEYLETVITK